MVNNVFTSLSKYNSAVDENYLTEAFVFVLNSLLESDRFACLDILRNLCVKENDFDFMHDESITISTQETTEQGRPDIKVSSPYKLIYIEVKHDSGLGDKQIQRYNEALKLSKAAIKEVVLLTRFAVDFNEEEEKPYKHIRWFQIYNWLYDLKVENPINEYLIKSFLKFLEVKNMSIQKIPWEYINGTPAFKNFINMLEVSIQAASLKVYKKSAGWDWMGFYIENKKKFCGIYYDKPLLLKFEVYAEKKTVSTATLNLESIHFFSLDKDEQLNQLTQFIKKCYKEQKG